MTATATNGRPGRRQLSDQLDRMDTILDALAEALPEAVADATREGARQAVREVLLELLANPDLRAAVTGLAAAAPAPAAPRPAATAGAWTRVRAMLAAARAAVSRRWRAGTTQARTLAATVRALAGVMPVRRYMLVGAAVGVAVGAAAFACPHTVAAALAGAGGAMAAIAAQVGRWLLRSAAAFGLAGPG
ncbi:MAG TPA: hypothetical protein VH092_15430 [Urbifossiella sp.]|jgi:hypothetical protein|nr:hypothetical protein [Urbifossiella sp.]